MLGWLVYAVCLAGPAPGAEGREVEIARMVEGLMARADARSEEWARRLEGERRERSLDLYRQWKGLLEGARDSGSEAFLHAMIETAIAGDINVVAWELFALEDDDEIEDKDAERKRLEAKRAAAERSREDAARLFAGAAEIAAEGEALASLDEGLRELFEESLRLQERHSQQLAKDAPEEILESAEKLHAVWRNTIIAATGLEDMAYLERFLHYQFSGSLAFGKGSHDSADGVLKKMRFRLMIRNAEDYLERTETYFAAGREAEPTAGEGDDDR